MIKSQECQRQFYLATRHNRATGDPALLARKSENLRQSSHPSVSLAEDADEVAASLIPQHIHRFSIRNLECTRQNSQQCNANHNQGRHCKKPKLNVDVVSVALQPILYG